MPDRRQPDSPTDDNPFAAPPEDRPDQPWQPRSGGDGGNGDSQKDADGQRGPARWDPTDPIQRRARYALLAGMWGFFFGIFRIPSVGLLLGALALYWGISALRGKPATTTAPDAPAGLDALGAAARPQRTAAVSGLVTAALAILMAMSSYALQLAYKDFHVCRDEALTKSAQLQCNTLLPDNIVGEYLKVRQ